MEYSSLKQRLVHLYILAYEDVLIKMNLRRTYFFQCFFINGELRSSLLENISSYAEAVINKGDQSFLGLPDEKIRVYFAVLAEDDIGGEIDLMFEGLDYGFYDIFDELTEEETGIAEA